MTTDTLKLKGPNEPLYFNMEMLQQLEQISLEQLQKARKVLEASGEVMQEEQFNTAVGQSTRIDEIVTAMLKAFADQYDIQPITSTEVSGIIAGIVLRLLRAASSPPKGSLELAGDGVEVAYALDQGMKRSKPALESLAVFLYMMKSLGKDLPKSPT